MRVSVIVITRNRASYIGDSLAAIQQQDYKDFDLIIVDSSTGDEQVKTAELAARHGAKYVPEPRRGYALARNTGLHHTDADIIAYTDDDCIPSKDWLTQAVKHFQDPEVWACTCRIVQHEKAGAAELFEEVAGQDLGGEQRVFTKEDTRFGLGFLLANVTKVFAKHMKSGAPVPFGIGHGSGMIFRSEVFKTVGDFNTLFGNSAVKYAIEDTELFYRILRSGHKIVYEPNAVVRHRHKMTTEAVVKTRYVYSYSGSALLWKTRGNPRMFIMWFGRLAQLLIKNLQYKITGNKALAESFGSDLKGFLDGWKACRELIKSQAAEAKTKTR